MTRRKSSIVVTVLDLKGVAFFMWVWLVKMNSLQLLLVCLSED